MALFNFGGSKSAPPPPTLSAGDVESANQSARALTAQTPEELQVLEFLRQQFPDADQNVLNEMAALHSRGEDLANVDEGYMMRAYQPAYERLMQDYGNMDRDLMENLNSRGIAAVPGGDSEQEAYQRMLLARDTKQKLSQNMMEAQNQAVQQKLAQYNARLAEVGQANTRRDQTFNPYYDATVVSETDRQANRTNAAANIYNARLGFDAKMHEINTGRKLAGQQSVMDAIGAGAGVAGSAIGAFALSDVNMKKDFEPAQDPEQDLNDINSIPVSRWRYQMEPEGEDMHTGGMAQDMPPDISPDGHSVDVVSYLGKATQAIQALTKRVSAFEQLLSGGGA